MVSTGDKTDLISIYDVATGKLRGGEEKNLRGADDGILDAAMCVCVCARECLLTTALLFAFCSGTAVSRGAAEGTGTASTAFEDNDCCLVAVAAASTITLYTPLPLEN